MREIEHWNNTTVVRVAESTGGVLVTTHPDHNMVKAVTPWPTPELLQKYYASSRFEGRTSEDKSAAESGLGHYSDLQSLNSEDAVTWSFFGGLAATIAVSGHEASGQLDAHRGPTLHAVKKRQRALPVRLPSKVLASAATPHG
jgi:hypothetical protein